MSDQKITDCKDIGCGECRVCEYLDYLEWAQSCAYPGGTIQYDADVDAYLDEHYPNWRK